MKIIHIFRDIHQNGGVPYEVRSLINSEIKDGHEIFIVTSKSKEKVNTNINAKCKLVLLNGNVIKDYLLIKKMIYKFEPDYLHFYSGWIPFNLYVWLLLRYLKKIPYIFSLHGILTPYIFKKRFGGKNNYPGFVFIKKAYHYIIDRNMLRNALAIHCLSEYEAELSNKIFKNINQIILPNGVDLISEKRTNLENFKQQKLTKIFFLGRLDIFQKGLDLLINACVILNREGYRNKYTIDLIGPSLNSSDIIIKTKINRYNLNNVFVKNSIPKEKLNSTIAGYSYLILPSRFEGLARVAREAVLNCVPVIASRESNFGIWVSKYNMGFCINDLSASSIANAIKRALTIDDLTYSDMRENTVNWVNDYSWDNVANELNLEMKKLLNVRS